MKRKAPGSFASIFRRAGADNLHNHAASLIAVSPHSSFFSGSLLLFWWSLSDM